MKLLSLHTGTIQPIGRGGPTLRVVNHPQLDYFQPGAQFVPTNPSAAAAWILVGFDRAPTIGAYDAIVPPFTDTLIAVPQGVAAVSLYWDYQGVVESSTASNDMRVLYGWSGAVSPGAIIPLDVLPAQIFGQPATRVLEPWHDWQSLTHYPSKWTTVYDQNLGNQIVNNPTFRPVLAPSKVLTYAPAVGGNVLTALAGLDPTNAAGLAASVHSARVLKKLLVTTSLAGTIVIGTGALTVGSPGLGEVARFTTLANVLNPIDFGEGLSLHHDGNDGIWQFYENAAATVMITAILG